MFESKKIPNTNIYMEISEFRQNPYINVATWICKIFLDKEMYWFSIWLQI